MRFEIMRLNDGSGPSQAVSGTAGETAVHSTVVDADTVSQIVQQASATGQRLYIRPAESPASPS